MTHMHESVYSDVVVYYIRYMIESPETGEMDVSHITSIIDYLPPGVCMQSEHTDSCEHALRIYPCIGRQPTVGPG
jgi:hypothetical protein